MNRVFNLTTLAASILAGTSLSNAASGPVSPRERILIDDGWRFTKGDPAGVDSKSLLYYVRPEYTKGDETKRRAEDTADASKGGGGGSKRESWFGEFSPHPMGRGCPKAG